MCLYNNNDNVIVETLQVGFSQDTVAVEEDAGMVTLAVGLNQNASVIIPIIITYSTSEVTGKTNAASKFALNVTLTSKHIIMSLWSSTVASSVDYTPVNGRVVFGIGECTKNITIPIIADSERESDEIFNVELDTDCCADVVIRQVQVNIIDSKYVSKT